MNSRKVFLGAGALFVWFGIAAGVGWQIHPWTDAHGVTQSQIAVLASVSGNVTTLACYDPNPTTAHPQYTNKPNPWSPCRSVDDNLDGVTGAHPGTLAVDLGAGAGNSVWAQLDYLPSAIRGGYVYTVDASGGCAAWAGATSRVWFYHYDGAGYTDVHGSQFQHISQGAGTLNLWKTWNNYWATNPLWPTYGMDFYLDKESSGGWSVGTVATPQAGAPAGCSTGAHIHQAHYDSSHSASYNASLYSEGCFRDNGAWGGTRCNTNPSTWAWVTGKPVDGRYSDITFLYITVH